jgi:hypothetical protein
MLIIATCFGTKLAHKFLAHNGVTGTKVELCLVMVGGVALCVLEVQSLAIQQPWPASLHNRPSGRPQGISVKGVGVSNLNTKGKHGKGKGKGKGKAPGAQWECITGVMGSYIGSCEKYSMLSH